jgi:TRAP-type C4-dicarboxylate transport system permease small subunit
VIEPTGSPGDGRTTAWLTWLASLCLGCAVTLMAVQVVLRFGFNAPQAWAEEVDRYLFVWSVYLGTIVAWMRGTHIRVTFVVDLLGPRAEAFSMALTRGLGLFCFAFVAWFGYQLAWKNRFSDFYTLPFMPQVLFYLSVPICLTFLSIHIVLTIVRTFPSMRR